MDLVIMPPTRKSSSSSFSTMRTRVAVLPTLGRPVIPIFGASSIVSCVGRTPYYATRLQKGVGRPLAASDERLRVLILDASPHVPGAEGEVTQEGDEEQDGAEVVVAVAQDGGHEHDGGRRVGERAAQLGQADAARHEEGREGGHEEGGPHVPADEDDAGEDDGAAGGRDADEVVVAVAPLEVVEAGEAQEAREEVGGGHGEDDEAGEEALG